MLIVRFKEDDEGFKIKEGDIFTAERAIEDDCKKNLRHRIPDGFNPECSAYNHQIERFTEDGKWQDIECSCC